MKALHAAALLHDIGKLAVPEHILTKPGKLTPEEFERMKVHPLVGAEILERVQFPYEVVPIVRSHHEKWDGSGYPDGLKEEEIPIGARILAAVDCLDALTSDRQYRPALPFSEAMAMIQGEAGKAFDRRVVEVLSRLHLNIYQVVNAPAAEPRENFRDRTKVVRGEAPGAGFQKTKAENSTGEPADFLHAIASAREEGQMLFELSQALGNSLSLDETLSVLAVPSQATHPPRFHCGLHFAKMATWSPNTCLGRTSASSHPCEFLWDRACVVGWRQTASLL